MVPVPCANRRFRLPLAVVVLLPTGSDCQRKFWLTGVVELLLNTDEVKVTVCEFFPAVAVAVPVVGRLKFPRTVAPPFTSSGVTGVVVFTPIFAVAPVPN